MLAARVIFVPSRVEPRSPSIGPSMPIIPDPEEESFFLSSSFFSESAASALSLSVSLALGGNETVLFDPDWQIAKEEPRPLTTPSRADAGTRPERSWIVFWSPVYPPKVTLLSAAVDPHVASSLRPLCEEAIEEGSRDRKGRKGR